LCSDDGLAAQLTEALGDDWLHVPEQGRSYQWDGKIWERDRTKKLLHLARHICRRVAGDIDDLRIATRVSSDHAIYAAAKIAATDQRHTILPEAFDANPWLLNTPGGIVDLRTGQLEPHDPAAMMTRIAGGDPTVAGPAGDCPLWEQFLRDATGKDLAMIEYLARVAGYCLTGSVEEHAIFFLYGPGGTGKTVFQTVLSLLLGDYAVSAPMDVFIVQTGERHPTELAHLAGARLVTAAETDDGRRWDEAKLKSISGGDKISARFSRGDFFDFHPMFKLVIAGNHRPRMRSADDAMRRRFNVIPFNRKPELVDKELIDKLRGELGGILKWAIADELDRRRLGGLKPPREVIAATDEYFEAENTLGQWVGERCICGKSESELVATLYRDFRDWAVRAGEHVQSMRVFAQKLRLLGGVAEAKPHLRGGRGFWGIALRHGDLPLPGLDGVGGAAVPANEVPIEPPDDPAEDWPRE
jgi:putative DNA primase/helicase